MNKLLIPILAGAAFATAAWRWGLYPTLQDANAVVSFGGTLASISATMLGFMLAAFAILASIAGTHLVQQMQTYGHYSDLLKTMLVDCTLFLFCAVSGYALLFGAPAKPWLLVLIGGLHMAAVVSLIDVGRKLWLVLSNLRPQ